MLFSEPVGAIPRNEKVKEEITEILEELQSSYVFTSADRKSCLVDHYVIVQQFTDLQLKATVPRPHLDPLFSALEQNPPATRVVSKRVHSHSKSCNTNYCSEKVSVTTVA